MIKHIWSVLCRESTINQEDNNLSIRDVFEALQVGLKPNPENPPKNGNIEAVIPFPYEVTSLITNTDDDVDTKIKTSVTIFNPKGEEVGKQEHDFTIPKGKRRMRIRMKNTGLKITGSGDYIFRVGIRKEKEKAYRTVAEIPLEVTVVIDKTTDKIPN